MILNFGHTFGHAIEKKYNYIGYTHGEAVAAGMIMAAEYGARNGICDSNVVKRITSLVKSFKLPERVDVDQATLSAAIAVDKKGKGDTVGLVIPERIGKVIIKDTKKDSIWIQ